MRKKKGNLAYAIQMLLDGKRVTRPGLSWSALKSSDNVTKKPIDYIELYNDYFGIWTDRNGGSPNGQHEYDFHNEDFSSQEWTEFDKRKSKS